MFCLHGNVYLIMWLSVLESVPDSSYLPILREVLALWRPRAGPLREGSGFELWPGHRVELLGKILYSLTMPLSRKPDEMLGNYHPWISIHKQEN